MTIGSIVAGLRSRAPRVSRPAAGAECFPPALAALIGRPLGSDRLAVAVSGGPDSLALLRLAHAAFGARVVALTVDHGLRPEAAGEAALVAARAATLGVEHVTLRWAGPYPAANLQAAARTARYALLGDWCRAHGVAWLATAHHADDAAETLLMRLARGSGSGGLAGIRATRDLGGVTLLRPLLDWRKAALAAVVADWGCVDDPSNRAPRFDRTRARGLLAGTPWLDPARLAAASAHLADAEAALAWTADLAWRGRATVTAAGVTVDAGGLPHDLARRLLVRAVAKLAPDAVTRGDAVERVLAVLAVGAAATLAGVAIRVAAGGDWHFSLAPRRRN